MKFVIQGNPNYLPGGNSFSQISERYRGRNRRRRNLKRKKLQVAVNNSADGLAQLSLDKARKQNPQKAKKMKFSSTFAGPLSNSKSLVTAGQMIFFFSIVFMADNIISLTLCNFECIILQVRRESIQMLLKLSPMAIKRLIGCLVLHRRNRKVK